MRSPQEIQDRIDLCGERIRESEDADERAAYRMERSTLSWVLG